MVNHKERKEHIEASRRKAPPFETSAFSAVKSPIVYLTRRDIAAILRQEAKVYEDSHRYPDGHIEDWEILAITAAFRAAAKIVAASGREHRQQARTRTQGVKR